MSASASLDINTAILAMNKQLSSLDEEACALEKQSKELISVVSQKLALCPPKATAIFTKNHWKKGEEFFLHVTSVYIPTKELARCSLVCKSWKKSMEGSKVVLKRQLKDMHPGVYSLIANIGLTAESLASILKLTNSLKATQAAVTRTELARISAKAEEDTICKAALIATKWGVIVALAHLFPADGPPPPDFIF